MGTELVGGSLGAAVILLLAQQGVGLLVEWQKGRLIAQKERQASAVKAEADEKEEIRRQRDELAKAVNAQLVDLRAEFASFKRDAEQEKREDRARIEELEGVVDEQRKTIRGQEDEIVILRRRVQELEGQRGGVR